MLAQGSHKDEKSRLTTGGSYTDVRVKQRMTEANPVWVEIRAAGGDGGLQAECWPWR